ncbi:MAG: hypothetical protein AAGB46_06695 [Verrucomicrobiota bacterium]
MSKVSDVLEILRRYSFWEESLARHTTIYPDGLGSDYWPIRRWSAVGEGVFGVLWIWPDNGFHGAWYLLSAWAAAQKGYQVYLPERSGAGIHPNRSGSFAEEEKRLLKKLIREWHPDLEVFEWRPVWKGDLVDEEGLRELRAPLEEVDALLGHEGVEEGLILRRVTAEWRAEELEI